MADQLQLRGGTTSEHSTFTGALREVTVDTDKDVLVVHDNSTAGGHPLMAEDGSNSALALGSAGTPSLKFTGDTNTGVFSPAADTVGVSTGGTERSRIDSSGRLLVGTSSSRAVSSQSGTEAGLQIETTSYLGLSIANNTNDGGGSELSIGKSRGTAVGGTTIVQNNDVLGVISFNGADGTDLQTNAARIAAEVDGTPGANDMPGRLVFSTTADGAASPTERMRIDSSGRVGIGVTIPSSLLHLVSSGQPTITVADNFGRKLELKAPDNSANPGFVGTTTNHDLLLQAGITSGGANAMRFETAGSERARIDSSGRLLVGTSSSNGKFYGTSTVNHFLQVETVDDYSQSWLCHGSSAGFGPHLTLGRTRGTAVGDTTIVQSEDLLGQISFQGADGTDCVAAAMIRAKVDGNPGANDMPGRLEFSTTADGAGSPSERMRITNAGFTKIANDAAYVNSSGLFHEIGSNQNSSDTLRVTHRGATSPYGIIVEFQNLSPDNNSNYFINCSDSTEARMRVYSDGDVVNHDNSYGSFSDQKLKQDIVDAGSQWDDLKNLRVRKFKFKSDVEAYGDNAKTLIGLVAQEAETVSPGLVKNNPDKDAENNDLGTVTKTVNYSVLYMKAIKALQEAMERIETLEAKVAALEAN